MSSAIAVAQETADLNEHRIWTKFCFRLEKPASEFKKTLKILPDDAMNKQTLEWYSR